MTRDAFADRLLDLAYGELSPREAREVEAHASSCEGCRAELARLRETRGIMASLPVEEPSPGGERILAAAARQAAAARGARRRARAPWRWGALAAAFSLVAVGAVSWRILAMRPGPLVRSDPDALLGRGPWAAAPPLPAPAGEGPGAAGVPPAPDRAARPALPPERAFAEAPPPRPTRERPRGAGEARRPPGGGAEAGAIPPSAPPPERTREPSRADEARAEAADRRPERTAAAPEAAGDRAPSAAPAPSAAAAPAPAAPAPQAKRAAAPTEARSAVREGTPRVEVRTFEGCEGEARRRVERDAEGRVVRYVREGRIAGRRVRIEHVYGPDGALARATVRDLDDAGAPLAPADLGVALPARAEDAGIDAPPRCGR